MGLWASVSFPEKQNNKEEVHFSEEAADETRHFPSIFSHFRLLVFVVRGRTGETGTGLQLEWKTAAAERRDRFVELTIQMSQSCLKFLEN